ncbi:MAG: lycopene cyclase [Bacteroidetes bacterium]|nr:lycopene cyclase [Bacteroidota bacterium]
MDSTVYDYAIVGAGAAGLHLAMAMNRHPFFADKKILLLEKSQKDENDKTWCFWEKGDGKWDHITTKIWDQAQFMSTDQSLDLNMGAYRYKMLASLDFYNYTKSELKKKENFVWVNAEVKNILHAKTSTIETDHGSYSAKHVFDSIIPPAFFQSKDKYTRLLQHFKGWVIETDEEVFNDQSFVMMDFRITVPNTTCFTYVLPINKKKALIEFTFFSPSLVEDAHYDELLRTYINQILKLNHYRIEAEEKGVIPMSDFPFHQFSNQYVTKIGTAGGWVKPASGYSFKNAERYSQRVVDNIKNNRPPGHRILNTLFRKYDMLFLDVLYHHNELGVGLFQTMYGKNEAHQILAFLDEETTRLEEFKIINSFPRWPFMRALFKKIF